MTISMAAAHGDFHGGVAPMTPLSPRTRRPLAKQPNDNPHLAGHGVDTAAPVRHGTENGRRLARVAQLAHETRQTGLRQAEAREFGTERQMIA